jgi:hypothetical protein
MISFVTITSYFQVTVPYTSFLYFCKFILCLSDPRDCLVYQDCSDRNLAIKHDCIAGTIYDAAHRVCTAAVQCNEVDCNLTNALILPYAIQSQYYIFCSMGRRHGEKLPIVLKCPEGRIYDPANFSCILDN